MDINLLNEFHIIVKHKNISEAAKELCTTQSALSRHLLSLEKEVGAKLLDRTKVPMELTPVGKVFLKKSVPVMFEHHRLLAFMASVRSGRFTTIRMGGLLDSVASRPLMVARKEMAAADPYVSFETLSIPHQTPFQMLREGELDIAIEPHSSLANSTGLESLHLAYERPFVIVEDASPIADLASLCVQDLKELDFVSLRSNRDYASRKHLQEICKMNGFEGDAPKSLYISTSDTYQDLLLQGLDGSALMLPES